MACAQLSELPEDARAQLFGDQAVYDRVNGGRNNYKQDAAELLDVLRDVETLAQDDDGGGDLVDHVDHQVSCAGLHGLAVAPSVS